MIRNDGEQFKSLKKKAILLQKYEIAYHAREVEKLVISNIKYGDPIPIEYFQYLRNKIYMLKDGNRIFNSWFRSLKILVILDKLNTKYS
jgi:hypothetical protein